jgi:hypothetical protein
MRTTPNLSAKVTTRLAGLLDCLVADLESGALPLLNFSQEGNVIKASIVHPTKGQVGCICLLDPPPEGYPPTLVSKAPPRPPPSTLPPNEVLWRLQPSAIERIEQSFKAAPGAIGAGELLVVAFAASPECGGGWCRVEVYVRSENQVSILLAFFGPIPRQALDAELGDEDLAVLVSVFSRLLKWDRELKAAKAEMRGAA